jgi:hypothetical protein
MTIELDGNKIDYIPKNDNEIIINLMEACKAIYGIIFKKKPAEDSGILSIKNPIYIILWNHFRHNSCSVYLFNIK